MNKKLVKDLEDATWFIDAANWKALKPDGQGLCIPISYALSEFLSLRGRATRIAEASVIGTDSRTPLRLEITPDEESGFLGHVVVLLPPQKILLDGSLWSQPSKLLANAQVPTLLVTNWQKALPAVAQLGPVKLTYRIDLKAKFWQGRNWPWQEIKDLAKRVERETR